MMKFTLKIESGKVINIKHKNIDSAAFKMKLSFFAGFGPDWVIYGEILKIGDGKIIGDIGKKAAYALAPAEETGCYRKVTVKAIAAIKLIKLAKKIYFPDFFVINYIEFGKSKVCLGHLL